MYSITGAGAAYVLTVTGVAGATYSITDAGAAQDEDGAGATSWVTGEGAVKDVQSAAYSITGAGVARVTSGAGATCSITGAGAVWTTGTGRSSTLEVCGNRCGRHIFDYTCWCYMDVGR